MSSFFENVREEKKSKEFLLQNDGDWYRREELLVCMLQGCIHDKRIQSKVTQCRVKPTHSKPTQFMHSLVSKQIF